eukprot:CAMPEP_0204600328 /NCGR_PEP_ID=MMETSP0661-20131031/55375_1 /ASSEMBLY_ACC=CAM_ASM_000606 /TAXON_ID=109239 /ORGANISM="Alexandrium margalefi, Strain AMGDE01CS-322" /LENGTH=399 /DNA_ID=CAMNT_0051611121 /DNA_START=76 /DNA_END=1272 /DNA_ORIENTATION=+
MVCTTARCLVALLALLTVLLPVPAGGMVVKRGPAEAEAPQPHDPDLEAISLRMQAGAGDAAVQAQGCGALANLVSLTKEQWETMKPSPRASTAIALGLDRAAVKAMADFPSSDGVQLNCTVALGHLAQWNPAAFEVLGKHGAVEAMANVVQADPDNPEKLAIAGFVGAYTDNLPGPGGSYSQTNMEVLDKTGMPMTVLKGMRKYANRGDIVLQGLCFFSNACNPPHLNAEMVSAGYLEDSVAFMRNLRRTEGVSGEVLWIADECFSVDAEHRRRQADAGLLEEVVETLRAANAGFKTDPITNNRMFQNALDLFGKYARASDEHRQRIVRAGAKAEIVAGMHSGLVDIASGCRTLRELGAHVSSSAPRYSIEGGRAAGRPGGRPGGRADGRTTSKHVGER